MHAIQANVADICDQARTIQRHKIDVKNLGYFNNLELPSVDVSHFNSLPHKFARIRN